MNWKNLFEKALNDTINNEHYWEEEIVLFKEFVESKDFCNHPPLSEIQYKELERFLGKNPKLIFSFENKYRECVMLWGKGSGKGTCVSLAILYLTYILLCIKSPHKYFKIAETDPLHIVVVAQSLQQAGRLYNRIVNRLLNCAWFKNKYNIFYQGKYIKKEENKETIEIKTNEIVFPKNIYLLSVPSQNERWEGLTIIAFAADELSGFTDPDHKINSDKIYATLTTSTRELPYIGFITSFPRLGEDEDFTYKLYIKAIKGERPDICASKYCTWEVKPKNFYSGETFKFVIDERTEEMVDVPIEYYQQAMKNPEDFKRRYMCIVTTSLGDFCQYLTPLKNIVFNKDIIETEDIIYSDEFSNKIRKNIVRIDYEKINYGYEYVIALDAGETESEAVLAIGHREDKKIIVDSIIVWSPNKEKDLTVDMNNYQETVEELAKIFPIKVVRLDHWNAATIEAYLNSKGIRTLRKNLNFDDYTKAKTILYSGLITLPDSYGQEFLKQFRNLKTKGTQKPKVVIGRQDICDAVVHLIDELYAVEIDMEIGKVIPKFVNPMFTIEKENIEGYFSLKHKVQNPKKNIGDDWAVIV